MERRAALKTLGVAVAAAVSAKAFAADHEHHHDHGAMAGSNGPIITATADCMKAGEACLAHCLVLLGQGDKEMAGCAKAVNEMLALCTALFKLASQNSSRVPALAKVVADACASCEKECRKHDKKHAECKACAEACATCLKECKKLAA